MMLSAQSLGPQAHGYAGRGAQRSKTPRPTLQRRPKRGGSFTSSLNITAAAFNSSGGSSSSDGGREEQKPSEDKAQQVHSPDEVVTATTGQPQPQQQQQEEIEMPYIRMLSVQELMVESDAAYDATVIFDAVNRGRAETERARAAGGSGYLGDVRST